MDGATYVELRSMVAALGLTQPRILAMFAGLDPISLGIVGQLIRKLNDALGITSVIVTHDVYESLKIVDYLYFVSAGRIIAQGTPDEVRASTDPFVRQFVDGEADGPVPFHVGAPPLAEEFAVHAG